MCGIISFLPLPPEYVELVLTGLVMGAIEQSGKPSDTAPITASQAFYVSLKFRTISHA